jgi:hypothetical protein
MKNDEIEFYLQKPNNIPLDLDFTESDKFAEVITKKKELDSNKIKSLSDN